MPGRGVYAFQGINHEEEDYEDRAGLGFFDEYGKGEKRRKGCFTRGRVREHRPDSLGRKVSSTLDCLDLDLVLVGQGLLTFVS